MYRVSVFLSSYDNRVVASIAEVEPVEWRGQTMYRDVHTGRVDPNYGGLQGKVCLTRAEAIASAVAGLQKLSEEFAAMCRTEIDKLRAEA